MLSNCILSMTTTFLHTLPPTTLFHFFYSYFVSFPFGYSSPQTTPHLHSLWDISLLLCKSRRRQGIYHIAFHNVKDFAPGCKCIRKQIKRSVCSKFVIFCVISQHCCSCRGGNVAETSLPLLRVDWFAVNEWDQEGEREEIVDRASLDGWGSFKAPVEQKKRGDRIGA